MSAALFPVVQFADANGLPLAGGLIYTYAAGTSTPLAAYTDSTGSVALANPVVLDSAGRAQIWLGQSNYKLIVKDSGGVTQWTLDGVSEVSLAQLTASSTFSSLSVTGNATISGNETVTGTLTAASLSVTGTENVAGALTAASLAVTGNESVGGNLSVTGTTTLTGALTAGAAAVSSLTIGGTTLTAFINALIPTLSALSGALVLSGIATSGSWVIFTFGTTAGTRVQVAFGAGTGNHGTNVSLPTGFSTSAWLATASMNYTDSNPGDNLDGIACNISPTGSITAQGFDHSSHTFSGVANWMAVAWRSGV